jgi:hypothetical protein
VVTHEQLGDAFGPLWAGKMPAEVADRLFTDPGDRWLMTEVGMPSSLLGQIYFGDVSADAPPTLAANIGGDDPSRIPADRRDDLVIANGMGGLAVFSRADRQIYWWEPRAGERQYALVNTSLDRFVETAYQIHVLFEGLDLEYEAGDDESPVEIGAEIRRIVGEIRDIDPPSFDSPAMFWQHVVMFSLETRAGE